MGRREKGKKRRRGNGEGGKVDLQTTAMNWSVGVLKGAACIWGARKSTAQRA